jgi:NADH-quinone oxidoreductase subunit H
MQLLTTIVTIAACLAVIMGLCAYQILLERKISAWLQDRLGPNRVGPFGLLQPIADGLKFLLKEDVIPARVDKLLYLLAPGIAFGTALLAFAVVPFGPTTTETPPERYQFVIAPRVDIGILYVFAIGSLTVYGIILGGWSANNKYSFIGALRSSAQLISYEIPVGLSILGVLLFTGSLNLERIIQYQVEHGWNLLYQPLAFLIFLTGVFAECNRLPFDLPEAEQELVGGYHTEYSALKFGLFFLGEYTHMITTSLLLACLFLGGWNFPFLTRIEGTAGSVMGFLVMMAKLAFFIFFYMWVRWTIPRFRFDQLMGLAWKVLIPLALANLVCVMIVKELGWSHWVLLPVSLGLLVAAGLVAARMPPVPQRSGSSLAAL